MQATAADRNRWVPLPCQPPQKWLTTALPVIQLLQSSHSFLCSVPRHLGWYRCPSIITCSRYLKQPEISALTAVCRTENLFGSRQRTKLVHEYKHKYSAGNLRTCPFRKTGSRFPMASSVMNLSQVHSTGAWTLSWRAVLRHNRKSFGYPYNRHAPVQAIRTSW